jgi:phospho-N-acetylmuramoyl-pentapeptide-transferase
VFDDAFFGQILSSAALGAALCALILFALLKTGLAWSLATDIPTHRSLHTRPTPRLGGWGVTPASALGVAWFAPQLVWLALLILALGAFCYIDDRRGLSARVRFAVQFVSAIAVCAIYVTLPWWLWPVAVIGLVWAANLYNFMDGADGLAGGMALIGFGAYAIASWPLAPALGAGAAAVAGAALGFLIFNWPPAKLFLGDAGSIPLGFLAGALGLIGAVAHIWAPWFPLVVFSPFITDATITLLRRLLRGERFWEAHREHYYQRMIQMDGEHKRTICLWYGLMMTGALVAFVMRQLQNSTGTLWPMLLGAMWAMILLVLAVYVDRGWTRFKESDDEK